MRFEFLFTFPIRLSPDSEWEMAEVDGKAEIDMDSGGAWKAHEIAVSVARVTAQGHVQSKWVTLPDTSDMRTEIDTWLHDVRSWDVCDAAEDERQSRRPQLAYSASMEA